MNHKLSCAEAMDLMNSRIAIGLLLASLAYGMDASAYLLTDAVNQVLNWVSFTISMLATLWVFRAVGPQLWKKLKSRSITHQEPESFITESFHKAIIKSWVFTIVALMLLKMLEKFISRIDLPVEFYINGLIFVMLFSSSVIFLVMTHGNEEDAHHEELV